MTWHALPTSQLLPRHGPIIFMSFIYPVMSNLLACRRVPGRKILSCESNYHSDWVGRGSNWAERTRPLSKFTEQAKLYMSER